MPIVDELIQLLTRTPAVLRALLSGLPEPLIHATEGGESWSPFDIVGHLIHGEEEDWIPRLRIILEHGEERPFEPFDRFAMIERSRGKTIAELLDDFETARRGNVAELRRLVADGLDLEQTGRHPELGRVTLGELLATWAAHDLSHLRQVARVLAKRYAHEVGPWRAYLPVMEEVRHDPPTSSGSSAPPRTRRAPSPPSARS
ncbi:MAG: DinB family protein [Gemmatimonadota bacterium]